jgi:hypothetical protein
MFSSRLLSFALLVLIHAPNISARGRGGGFGSGIVKSTLNLSSVDAASFSFCIIFAILIALQAIQALGAMKKRRAEEDFPRRLPFIILTFLAILSMVASFALYATANSQMDLTYSTINLMVVDPMLDFVTELAAIFLYAAVLLLLDYRNTVQALQYGHSKSRHFVILIRSTSAVLLVIMFTSALSRAIIGATNSFAYSFDEQPPLALRVYKALYHLYLSCRIVTVVLICGVALVLWTNRRPMESKPECFLFDTNVSN